MARGAHGGPTLTAGRVKPLHVRVVAAVPVWVAFNEEFFQPVHLMFQVETSPRL